MSDIVTLKVAAPPEQVVLKVPAEPVATIIRVSEPGGADTEYVDAGDARTLAEAKEYTDDHVVPVGYIDDGDEQTLLDAKGYADQVYRDLGTEIDSLTPTISRIDLTSSHNEYRILELKGQVDNLPAADVTKAYVDTGLSNKSDKSHQHDARDLISGVLPPARLGTGTANAASFLSGDGTFKIPPGTTNAQIESAVQAYLAANPPGGDPWHKVGDGMPNGVVTGNPGTIYRDTAGTNGAWLWIKKVGTNNQGWVVLSGDTGRRDLSTYVTWVNALGTAYFQQDENGAVLSFLFTNTSAGDVVYCSGLGNYAPPGNLVERTTQILWNTGAVMGGGYILSGTEFKGAAPIGNNRIAVFRWKPTAWPTTLPGTPV